MKQFGKTIHEHPDFQNYVFHKPKGISNLAYLPMLYLIAFFISFGLSILLDFHDYIIAAILVIFTVFAVVYNLYVLKYLNFQYTLQEYQYQLLLSAFNQKVDSFAFFDNDGKIIYANQNLHNLIKLSNKNISELDKLLLVLNTYPSISQKIRDFILRAVVYNSFAEQDQVAQLFIPNIVIFNNRYSLYLDLIDSQNIVTSLTLVKEEKHSELDFIDQFNIGFYETDIQGRLIKVNDNFAKMLGYQTKELIDTELSIQALINDEEGKVDNKRNMLDNWQGLVSLTTKHNDTGAFFISHKPLIDYSGSTHVDKIIGFISKIKDRSLLLKTIKTEQSVLDFSWKSFFEESPYPVCIVARSGIINRANQACLKYFTEDIVGKNLTEFFNEKDNKLIIKQMQEVSAGLGKSKPITVMYANNKVFDIYIGRILDLDGGFEAFIIRITDITHQKQLEENFSHSQRMQTIGHLVGAVAHDFNNILTAISGFCDLLLMRHGIGDPSFSDIMQIKQSADRASSLVKRLLAFSRKQTLKLQPVNTAEFFSETYPLIQRLIGSRIKFSQQIPPDIWMIKVDPVQMQQVILNLVVNAHQAMSQGGTLTIKVENYELNNIKDQLRLYNAPAGEESPDIGEYVKIIVEDTGEGIPKGNIQKVFEPFFTTRSEKIGTGFGLSTVYGTVRQSGGFVYVQSKEGQGTKFILLFRKYNEEEAEEDKAIVFPVSSPSKKDLESNLSGDGKIVIIEDEEAIRIFAKSVLIGKGYEVIEFSSAKSASEKLSKIIDTVDLIITDVVMPEMSGPTLISNIRKIKPDIKVIFISGYAEEIFTEEYGKKRDFHFIPKPFSLKQLVAKVKEVIEG